MPLSLQPTSKLKPIKKRPGNVVPIGTPGSRRISPGSKAFMPQPIRRKPLPKKPIKPRRKLPKRGRRRLIQK